MVGIRGNLFGDWRVYPGVSGRRHTSTLWSETTGSCRGLGRNISLVLVWIKSCCCCCCFLFYVFCDKVPIYWNEWSFCRFRRRKETLDPCCPECYLVVGHRPFRRFCLLVLCSAVTCWSGRVFCVKWNWLYLLLEEKVFALLSFVTTEKIEN